MDPVTLERHYDGKLREQSLCISAACVRMALMLINERVIALSQALSAKMARCVRAS